MSYKVKIGKVEIMTDTVEEMAALLKKTVSKAEERGTPYIKTRKRRHLSGGWRAPRWTKEELKKLNDNADKPIQALRKLFPTRTDGSIYMKKFNLVNKKIETPSVSPSWSVPSTL